MVLWGRFYDHAILWPWPPSLPRMLALVSTGRVHYFSLLLILGGTCSIPLWLLPSTLPRSGTKHWCPDTGFFWVHLCHGAYLNLPAFMYVCMCTSALMMMRVHVCVCACVFECTSVGVGLTSDVIPLEPSICFLSFFFFEFYFIDEGKWIPEKIPNLLFMVNSW